MKMFKKSKTTLEMRECRHANPSTSWLTECTADRCNHYKLKNPELTNPLVLMTYLEPQVVDPLADPSRAY